MQFALEKRITHSYVGTYSDLDKWEEIGVLCDEIAVREVPPTEEDEQDICEPKHHIAYCLIELTPAAYERWLEQPIDPTHLELDYDTWLNREIKNALLDRYTRQGCAHEYDCCGCRSMSAESAVVVTGNLWRVDIRSSRNF